MTPTLKIQNGELVPVGGTYLWEEFIRKNDGEIIEIKLKDNSRTARQNNALHAYFALVATELSQAGIDVVTFLKRPVEIAFTPILVKEMLWRTCQKLTLNKESTKNLTTKEVNQVYDVMNRVLADRGVHVPFPSNMPDEFEL